MVRAVAAGVGGTGGWQALAWAVEEADLSATRLVIVRGYPPGSPPELVAGSLAQVELHDPPLARAVRAARDRLGGQRVTLQIRLGDPAAALIAASAGTDLLVVGPAGRIGRRVLRRAHCPVVVVRPLPHGGGPFAGHVVVGVDGSPAARGALEYAFAYADEHRLPLVAAYVAEHTDTDYTDADRARSASAPADPPALDLLGTEVGPWSLKFPHIAVRRAVLCGGVAEGLVRASAGAALLVVGDKRRGPVGRAVTGDVPIAVTRAAAGPVALVPMDRREGPPL